MVAVNRTLGPPWNIWADQGDTLMFRDFGWIQFYCDSNQDVADTILLAFRLAEDHRILLPVMVCMDAFIVSHTSMETVLGNQAQADRYLPICDVPHRLDGDHPVAVGALAWPQETLSQRMDLHEAMLRVPSALDEHRAYFQQTFGREVSGAVEQWYTEDADEILVASGTISVTALEVVRKLRAQQRRVGLIRIKLFRPFPEDQVRALCANTARIGVLDRNYAAGSGGIFCREVRAALQGQGETLIQGYLAGVGGGDVVPSLLEEALADLTARHHSGDAVWLGIDR
jgi:pyruvate/2-oxoacid:ferredoxin oxidoreductase alpha subunit